MITTGSCLHCGAPLNPAMRSDATFCSPACRLAHWRGTAGPVLPMHPRSDILERFVHIEPRGDPLERALAQFRQVEKSLEAARERVRAAAKEKGIKTAGIFAGSTFVLRSSADKWLAEAEAEAEARASMPPTPASEPRYAPNVKDPVMAAMRERDLSRSVPVLPETEEEEAARINALPAEEKALMVVNAARKRDGLPPLARLPHQGPRQDGD